MFSKIINYFKKELSFKGFGFNLKTAIWVTSIAVFTLRVCFYQGDKTINVWPWEILIYPVVLYFLLLTARANVYFCESKNKFYRNAFLIIWFLSTALYVTSIFNDIFKASMLMELAQQSIHPSLGLMLLVVISILMIFIHYKASPKGVWLYFKAYVLFYLLSFIIVLPKIINNLMYVLGWKSV